MEFSNGRMGWISKLPGFHFLPSLSFVSNEWSGEVYLRHLGGENGKNKPWIIPALSSFTHSFTLVCSS